METVFEILEPGVSVTFAIDIVIRRHQRIIPIVENVKNPNTNQLIENLIGVISHSDIVQYLMNEPSRVQTMLDDQRNMIADVQKR